LAAETMWRSTVVFPASGGPVIASMPVGEPSEFSIPRR
jgi:hypothetical protein